MNRESSTDSFLSRIFCVGISEKYRNSVKPMNLPNYEHLNNIELIFLYMYTTNENSIKSWVRIHLKPTDTAIPDSRVRFAVKPEGSQ